MPAAPAGAIVVGVPAVDPEVMDMVRKVVPVVLVAAVAVALSPQLRNRVLDLLFGAEEEFDYTPTTSGAAPPSD